MHYVKDAIQTIRRATMTYLGNSRGFIVKNQTKHGYTVGGKAEQLNNINSNLVPNYVVIPTEVDDCELGEAIYNAVIKLSADFKAFIFNSNANSRHKYAVRSSAVGEDGEGQSYAGIFESKLNVPVTGLETAVREVRDSANTGRVQAYSNHPINFNGCLKKNCSVHGDNEGTQKVAVIIMDMVDARYSGVLFSKEPVDGTDRMLVEYEEGAGGVVDGTGNSTMFFLDKKDFYGKDTTDTIGGGIDHVNATMAIWKEAKRLENNYRKPVDIEWAIDKEGKPWVLQVRPITAMKESTNA